LIIADTIAITESDALIIYDDEEEQKKKGAPKSINQYDQSINQSF